MNTNSNIYIVNAVDLEEKTTYRVNMNSNKKYLSIKYYFSDGTFKNLYNFSSDKYLLGKVEIYIHRKTDTLIEFDDKYIRYTCNIDEVNKTVEITKKALILSTDNKQEYTPTKDYNPATKKYVDDKEDKILSLSNNNASIFKITLTDEEMNNLMSTNFGDYFILNSIEPSFIEDIVNNGYWDYNMIMFNDKLLLKINSIGSGSVSCINSMTNNSINFVIIEEGYTEDKNTPIVFVLESSLAVINLNGEKKVAFAFGNSRQHKLINNYYLDELIKFDSQGNLVVTINGVSKTFVPKPPE